jgi:hypothetical protein
LAKTLTSAKRQQQTSAYQRTRGAELRALLNKKKRAEAPFMLVSAIAAVIPISTAVSAMISVAIASTDSVAAVTIDGGSADTPIRAANQSHILKV